MRTPEVTQANTLEGRPMRAVRVSVLVAVTAAFLAISAIASANPGKVVAQDDCDAASFNVAVPANPPTCVGSGTTTFGDFVGQLVDHKLAGAWHAPLLLRDPSVDARDGARLLGSRFVRGSALCASADV